MVFPDEGAQEPGTAPQWKVGLSGIPSVFGRLVYLHRLEDQDRLIGHTHQQVFSHWLGLGLSDQIRELRDYFRNFPGVLDYRRLVPANARDVERQLFLTDMETLLELLRLEGNSALPAV